MARCATREYQQFPLGAVICVVARHAVNTLHKFPWQSWEILRPLFGVIQTLRETKEEETLQCKLEVFLLLLFNTSFHWNERPNSQRTKQHGPCAFMSRRTDGILISDIKFPRIVQHFAQTTNTGWLATVKQSPICWAMHDSSHVATYKYWRGMCKTKHTACAIITATYTVDKKLGKMAAH